MPARAPLTWHREDDQLVLAGSIDESAKLVDLVGLAHDGRLALDLADVTFINSVGVREWIRMQAAAQAIGVRIELRRVCKLLVNQLNIVPAARGVSIVTSFYAPYDCAHCEADEICLIDVAVHGSKLARGEPPPLPCPRCQREMTLSHPPELYLSFLVG